MKFDCGPTARQQNDACRAWHLWFAWHPVRIGDSRQCVWLEKVERKGEFYFDSMGGSWAWEYRLPSPQPAEQK
jgi:hypothetical protein